MPVPSSKQNYVQFERCQGERVHSLQGVSSARGSPRRSECGRSWAGHRSPPSARSGGDGRRSGTDEHEGLLRPLSERSC
jgi:hypothetical protein